jgi:hypothetical protein
MSDEVFGAYGHANMIRRAYARAYARGYARVHGRGHASLRDDADVRILHGVLRIRICPTLRQ